MNHYFQYLKDKFLWNDFTSRVDVKSYISKDENINKLITAFDNLSINHPIISHINNKCPFRENLLFINNNNLYVNKNIFDTNKDEYFKLVDNPPLYHSFIYLTNNKIGDAMKFPSPSFCFFNSLFNYIKFDNLNLIAFFHYDINAKQIHFCNYSFFTNVIIFFPFKDNKLIPNKSPFLNENIMRKLIQT